jgi:hypothetical protein
MQLVKGQNSGDPFYKAVEKVVQDLDLRIKNIMNSQQESEDASTTDISPPRVMSFLFFIVLLYKALSLLFILEVIYSCYLSQKSMFPVS